MKINKKIIEELVGYLKEFNLSEIDYAEGTTKVKVSRKINFDNISSNPVKKKELEIKESNDSNLKISSPIVGTAYLAPEPGAKKFVEEGQKIKKGQTIMIIEAMKTMNHVPSTQDGIVSKVLVKDGAPVEFGQPLVSLKLCFKKF
jgi:acetyl-CoA carboxylase biotin carboxyl carrier protein